jgi:isoleucyl-tRNA synthetase
VLEDPSTFRLAGIKRKVDGGPTVMYLEGSDQHRGWFHSSLLESCGTRGRAPFDVVLTHGFTLDENGRKMSKSLGNTVAPQDVIKQSGADILRLWVCATDYADDQRIGPEILKTTSRPTASCATPSAGCSARSRISSGDAVAPPRCRSWSG